MNCDELNKYIDDYIDGTLSEELSKSFEEHLSVCDKCKEEVEVEKRLVSSLKKLRVEHSPESIRNNVLEKVQGSRDKKSFVERLFSPFIIKIPATSAALILIVIATIYIYTSISKKDLIKSSIPQKDVIVDEFLYSESKLEATQSPKPATSEPKGRSLFEDREETRFKSGIDMQQAGLKSKEKPSISKKKPPAFPLSPVSSTSTEGEIGSVAIDKEAKAEVSSEKVMEKDGDVKKLGESNDLYYSDFVSIKKEKIPQSAPVSPSEPSREPAEIRLSDKDEDHQKYTVETKESWYAPETKAQNNFYKMGDNLGTSPAKRMVGGKQKIAQTAISEKSMESEGIKYNRNVPQALPMRVSPTPTPLYLDLLQKEKVSEKYVFVSNNYDKTIKNIKKILSKYDYNYENLIRVQSEPKKKELVYIKTTYDKWNAIKNDLDKVISKSKVEKFALAGEKKKDYEFKESNERLGLERAATVARDNVVSSPEELITVVIEIEIRQ